MNWFLIALRGALHLAHLDSNGQGTIINILNVNGFKFWIIASLIKFLEQNEQERAEAMAELANIRLYLEFHLELPSPKFWVLEGVLLTHETTLYVPLLYIFIQL
jgi:hypothetical protein